VFDPHRLLRERYGKARTREQRVVSSGAFQKMRWQRVDDPERFLASYPGRRVAAVAAADAAELTDYRFLESDLLLFGSESQGLPPPLVAQCTSKVTIQSHGQTQSLNLAVALGIVLFECERQKKCSPG
jgi:tRNA G18 (ribose-2'-O)-methylase SpoU